MSYSLSFSKAILVVIFISDKIRQKQFDYLSSKMIAETLNIPKPTLVKIVQGLIAAGIIETKEGKTGGIRLRKPASEITILDILTATESGKSLFQTNFNIMAEGKRPDNAQKLVAGILNGAEDKMKAVLKQTTIEEILMDMGK